MWLQGGINHFELYAEKIQKKKTIFFLCVCLFLPLLLSARWSVCLSSFKLDGVYPVDKTTFHIVKKKVTCDT